MAKIENGGSVFPLMWHLAARWHQLIFYKFIHIFQFYKEDCTFLQICWAVALPSTDQTFEHICPILGVHISGRKYIYLPHMMHVH